MRFRGLTLYEQHRSPIRNQEKICFAFFLVTQVIELGPRFAQCRPGLHSFPQMKSDKVLEAGAWRGNITPVIEVDLALLTNGASQLPAVWRHPEKVIEVRQDFEPIANRLERNIQVLTKTVYRQRASDTRLEQMYEQFQLRDVPDIGGVADILAHKQLIPRCAPGSVELGVCTDVRFGKAREFEQSLEHLARLGIRPHRPGRI